MKKALSIKEVKNDVFTLLTKDHNKVRALLKKLMTGKSKEETFEKIVMPLDYHTDYEETYLYPELKGTKINFEIIEAEEEHKVGKNIEAEIKSESKDTDRWLAKSIEHHAKEEKLFVNFRKILTQEKSVGLVNQFIMESQRNNLV